MLRFLESKEALKHITAIKPHVFTIKLMTTSNDGKFMLFLCCGSLHLKNLTLVSTLGLIHTGSRPSFGATQ